MSLIVRSLASSVFFGLSLLVTSLAAIAESTVLIVDIDRAGQQTVEAIKRDSRVDSWSEIGARLVIQVSGKSGDSIAGELTAEGRVLKRFNSLALEQLAVVPRVHHLVNGNREQRIGADITGLSSRWYIERADGNAEQSPLSDHQVLSYQLGNRGNAKSLNDPALVALAAQVRPDRWRRTLDRLAGFNRQTASGFQAGLGVVGQAFEEAGLEVSIEEFDSTGSFPPPLEPGHNFNVLGFKPGLDESVVVVGAHLDSRNRNFNDSLPSPGAEDNASGCAGVIEAARILAPLLSQHGVLFICFGLEERGLFGSYGHVVAAQSAGLDIVGMINMDMIAFDGDSRLDLLMDTSSVGREMTQQLGALAQSYTALEVEIAEGLGRSDHSPYLQAGIPAVLLIENDFDIFPNYHSSNDRPDSLSNRMAGEVIKVALLGAAKLAAIEPSADLYDGHWYDPPQTGQGFHIQGLGSGTAVLAWYTYDVTGKPYWLVGTGTLVGGTAEFSMSSTSGGTFPPSLQPAGITYQPWGALKILFADCNHANAQWTPVPGSLFSAGSMPLVRLTTPVSSHCQ